MSKNFVITGIVIIVLVGLGIWYFSSSNVSLNTTNPYGAATTSVSTTSTSTATTSHTNTFHSIFTQTGNYECSYESVGGTSVRSSSVIYIADGKMRGEFRTTTNTVTSANFMIYNGGYLYAWKEGATVGTKTTIKTLADLPAIIPTDLTSGKILGVSDNNVSWDCHNWAKDDSVFVIPSYVKFSVN